MPVITICFASRYGQTERIANRIAKQLAQQNCDVLLHNIVLDGALPKSDYYIVGAPVMYGNAWTPMRKWLAAHRETLSAKVVAVFNVNLTARKPGKRHIDNNPYLAKLLALLPEGIQHKQVFAGALDYPSYPWYDRLMIKLIMHITGGPKRCGHRIDYTYWPDVDRFAEQIASSTQ
ncbi:menaquinone-dependent protoporphyrinogen IX dehydrogenase [Salinibius halmophilus]|uniref:menaquinone-dependent protoporphyrinogen IX dehydrogenase n=1 Tax=Salinibius halmophilus TaxID=1853216 RepID=UPI00131406B9|nr:menaquinone-dependent protoporphyrinogen IX dehydrogenase [Salinibius halmophilus]